MAAAELPETAHRVAAALGTRAAAARAVRGGYSSAERLVVELAGGSTVFAKCGREELIAELLRVEHRTYRALQTAFTPRLVAFLDEPPPVLVLEDLSGGYWPPPWAPGTVETVLATLGAVRATAPPAAVPPIAVERDRLTGGWGEIAARPEPFLALGVCSRQWLERALHALAEAAERAPIEGEELLHLDVRSDNVCVREGGAVLVDWNQACVGNGDLDVAAWLPSLRLEGGPEPEELLPGCPAGFGALLAGFFGARAGLPPPPTAPHVRPLQLAQLRVALPWAARQLDLPPPE